MQSNPFKEMPYAAAVPRPGHPLAVPRTWAVGVLLVALIVAFLPTVIDPLLRAWLKFGAFYGHGLLTLLLIADILWSDRQRVFGSRQPGALVLALLAWGLSLTWALAWLAAIRTAMPAVVLLTMLAASCALLGWRSLWTFGAPFGLIFLAVPMWDPVSLVLQDVSTVMVGLMLDAAHIPALVEGNMIDIPAGTFEIQTGCSGLGFLLVSGTLAGYLSLRYRCSMRATLVIMLVAAALGIIANWVRIFVIVLIAHYWGMDQPVIHDHVWLGWVIYSIPMLPLMWYGVRWLEHRRPAQHAGGSSGTIRWQFFATVLVAATAPPLVARGADYLADPRPESFVLPAEELPADRDGGISWSRVTPAADTEWQPAFPEASRTWIQVFEGSDGGRITAFAAYYPHQAQGREVISGANDLAGVGWQRAGRRLSSVVVEGRTFPVAEQRLSDAAGDSLCVWYWYRIGDGFAVTPLRAKVEQIRQVLGGRSDGSIAAVATRASDLTCRTASPRLDSFAAQWLAAYR